LNICSFALPAWEYQRDKCLKLHVSCKTRKRASWEQNLAKLSGYGAAVTCQAWRNPRTTTTISWCDGELGPLFVTFGDGQVSDKDVSEVNSQYQGTLHVEHVCKKTHMWNGETCLKFLDFMSKEIRRKRLSLGYKDASEAPCLGICDRAPSHQSQIFQTLRANWAKENNVILLGADVDGPCPVPGGFGATMQPNDRRGAKLPKKTLKNEAKLPYRGYQKNVCICIYIYIWFVISWVGTQN
jgi:hypothetical protein